MDQIMMKIFGRYVITFKCIWLCWHITSFEVLQHKETKRTKKQLNDNNRRHIHFYSDSIHSFLNWQWSWKLSTGKIKMRTFVWTFYWSWFDVGVLSPSFLHVSECIHSDDFSHFCAQLAFVVLLTACFSLLSFVRLTF